MGIFFDQDFFKQIHEIAEIVRMEGNSVYSCSTSASECWISFCGLSACFINGDIAYLKSGDLEVSLSCVLIANDNPENIEEISQDLHCAPGYRKAIQFINGTPETLNHWHNDIVSFVQQGYSHI